MLACGCAGPLPVSAIRHIERLPAGIRDERGPGRIEPAPVLKLQGGVEVEKIGGSELRRKLHAQISRS
jgi:hypothetical protein